MSAARLALAWVAPLAMLAAVTSCGEAGDDQLVVLAASSLTDVFEAVESEFEAANPGVDVVISFGGSSSLATQILNGVPADVFAAADSDTMRRVVDAGEAVGVPSIFATNRLVLVVEPGNPAEVTGLADLAREDLVVVLAAPNVPAGRYAAAVLDRADVTASPSSLEANVRAVAGKVALGEADVGIVYATDVTPGETDVIELPTDIGVAATYPIVATSDDLVAQAFVDFVLGPDGQAELRDAGFGAP